MKKEAENTGVVLYSRRHLVFVVPLLLLHFACLLVFWVGVSSTALKVFAVFTFVRCFGITAGYHRLLSHQSYKTSRTVRFVIILMGTLAGQNGPLWWVAHHRIHHRFSDHDGDVHSPRDGFFWSHVGWLFSPTNTVALMRMVPDLMRQPEIMFLQRYYYVFHALLFIGLFTVGEILRVHQPGLHTSGMQLVIWGGVLSMVCVFHCVWSANSVCHTYGSRRFKTRDNSRNNILVALVTLGDGWHNNHHQYPSSARHGLVWWELDINYLLLKLLRILGIVWDLRQPGKVLTQDSGIKEI
ncbi:MAG: delta 9 acyl-lipid fatty acid desaturase [marine bacterium B5-7]|nr:MAG: delta 9 acyl-lipid fatty acid desaturase [marine bacterium B5-7]